MKHIKKDFPFLAQKVGKYPITYFDNAATSQKPQSVIDSITQFYTQFNNTIHRAVYSGGEQTTALYEQARAQIAVFLNADSSEIIFTKGTTEGINFVARTWGQQNVTPRDQIVLTELEHHSNLIPWQQLAQQKNARLSFIPIDHQGILQYEKLPEIITQKTKLVSAVHVSNALGTTNDIEVLIKAAHAVGARILIDAAQSAPHQKIDVKKLNCDFLVFSGHKLLGPTGIGILYIKKELHHQIDPYQFGGGMIYEADYQQATWQKAPHKFEAGTPPICAAIALARAVEYLVPHIDDLRNHEAELCHLLIDRLQEVESVTVLGPIEQLRKQGHLVSFISSRMHAHDIATALSNYGICVRAGNHCAQPLAKKMGITASVRASFYLYNTKEEVEFFAAILKKILQ